MNRLSLREFFAIYAAYLRKGAKVLLQYRGDAVISGISIIIQQMVAFIGVVVIVSIAGNIGGWGLYDIILLYSFFMMVRALNNALFDSVWNIGNVYVRYGLLDVVLTRPVPPFLQLICNRFEFSAFGLFVIGGGVSVWALNMAGVSFTISVFFMYVLFIICGIIITTSLYLIVNATNFWLVRGNEVSVLLQTVEEFSRYPIRVFPVVIQVLMTFIFPFAFTTFYPASILTGRVEFSAIIWLPLASIIVMFAASLVWRAGLKSYNSTGS